MTEILTAATIASVVAPDSALQPTLQPALPPSQREIMLAILQELKEAALGRDALRQRLEARFRLSEAQKTHRVGNTASLWSLRYRHAVSDLALAGLLAKDGGARRTPLSLTDAGRSVPNPDAVTKAVRNARRGSAPVPTKRARLSAPLPHCGLMLTAILEAIAESAEPITNAALATAVARKLDIADRVMGPGGHDLLKARIAASSYRLWQSGLIERVGNGRRFASYLTEVGKRSLANPASSPIKLPTEVKAGTDSIVTPAPLANAA